MSGKMEPGIAGAANGKHLELLLFTHDVEYAAAAMDAGMGAIVIDWEWSDKTGRQAGWNTEVNHGTDDDLEAMRSRLRGHIVCRVNNTPQARKIEARRAVDLGADEIWLPMVRAVSEVEECLAAVDGNAAVGVLVETGQALNLGRELSRLPLARVYMGLNDLHIDTGSDNLFSALGDGTVEEFRSAFSGKFGVAGVTRPGCGRPLPARLLLAEMARLSCDFAVARRSFRADVPALELPAALREIRACHRRLTQRNAAEVAVDHAAFLEALAGVTARRPVVAEQ